MKYYTPQQNFQKNKSNMDYKTEVSIQLLKHNLI